MPGAHRAHPHTVATAQTTALNDAGRSLINQVSRQSALAQRAPEGLRTLAIR